MYRLSLCLALALLSASSSSVSAAVVVSIPSAIIAPGGTATLDVTIAYDAASAPDPNLLSVYGLKFRIVQDGGATGFLQFLDPQTAAYNTGLPYVFDAVGTTPLFPHDVITTIYPADTFLVGDALDTTVSPAENVTLTAGNKLLASLQFTAALAATGDRFSISLAPDADTYFYYTDVNGDPVPLDYTSDVGTVRIRGSVAAVPEPSTLSLLAGAVVVAAARRLTYRRRRSTG